MTVEGFQTNEDAVERVVNQKMRSDWVGCQLGCQGPSNIRLGLLQNRSKPMRMSAIQIREVTCTVLVDHIRRDEVLRFPARRDRPDWQSDPILPNSDVR